MCCVSGPLCVTKYLSDVKRIILNGWLETEILSTPTTYNVKYTYSTLCLVNIETVFHKVYYRIEVGRIVKDGVAYVFGI